MPGFHATQPDSYARGTPTTRDHSRVTSRHHGGRPTNHDSQHSSNQYKPPYHFVATTTAYGLNEPQWSVGPPPLKFEESPYYRIPLPRQPSFNVHPLLRGGSDPRSQPIVWYVNQPSPSARISSSSLRDNTYHWRALPAASLTSSSGSPSSITIRFGSATPFTRPIVVFPSNTHSGVITIGDVLNAVYHGLRQCANDVLCETMGIVPSLMTAQVAQGFSSPSQGSGDDEVGTHVAQCLNFHTQWAGLIPSPVEKDVWVLHTQNFPTR